MGAEMSQVAAEPGELAAFLKARRSQLDPEAAGLDVTGNRRVRGLRREEVAQLATISTDYYTRLEQGRLVSASEEVLDALSTALRLSPDERSYFFKLANKGDLNHRSRPRDAEGVCQQTRQILESLQDCPALVLGRHMDLLAWNQLSTAVFKDFATVNRQERNFLRMLFLDADVRSRFVDWEIVARTAVGFVRASVAGSSEPGLVQLIGELSLSDPDFRTWWAERHVNYETSGIRTFTHPLTGAYSLERKFLFLLDDDQILMVLTAPPGTGSLEVLHRLARLTQPEISSNSTAAP